MLTIDRILLHLPPGFESRAKRIAWLLADELASFRPVADRNIERLSPPPVLLEQNAGDRDVARAVARAVTSAAGLPKGGQP